MQINLITFIWELLLRDRKLFHKLLALDKGSFPLLKYALLIQREIGYG